MKASLKTEINNLLASLDSKKPCLVFACGGTSGHINPALSVAETILQINPDVQIIFCGTAKGLENTLVRQAGYRFFPIDAKPFHRNFKALVDATYTLWRSQRVAKLLLKILKPKAVFGTGGYVCAPVLSAAKALKLPVIIHEQNAFPGKSNLMLAKHADLLCYSYAETKAKFKQAKRTLLTGNPVPARFFAEKRDLARQELGLDPQAHYVLVVGGSLGAKRLNEAVFGLAEFYRQNQQTLPYKIIVALGAKGSLDFQTEMQTYADLIESKTYIYNMEKYYAAVDLVVCRAGALTLAELAAVGRPALFVPYPYAAQDHQTVNAKAFEKAGAATLCKDCEMSSDYLRETLDKLFAEPEKLQKMGEQAKKLAYKDAAMTIAKEILQLAKL